MMNNDPGLGGKTRCQNTTGLSHFQMVVVSSQVVGEDGAGSCSKSPSQPEKRNDFLI